MRDAQSPEGLLRRKAVSLSCRRSSPPEPSQPRRGRREAFAVPGLAATGSVVKHLSTRRAVWPHSLEIGEMLTTMHVHTA